MGSGLSRRHHYIPKMLLRNFCDDDDLLWVGDRTHGRIYRCGPEGVFVKRDLNMKYSFDSVQIDHGYNEFLSSIDMSDEYERTLSRIENRAAPIVRKIIQQARCNRCPQLTPEECNNWKGFVLAMVRRTPESQKRVASDRSFDDIFYEVAVAVAKKDNYMGLPDRAAIFEDLRIAKFKDLVKSNADARFAAGDRCRDRKETERFSGETGLCIAVIRAPKRGFVIGSHGLAIVQASHQNEPGQGAWLPIAHDVAVSSTPFPDRETLVFLDRESDRIIKRINKASVAQSQIVAGRSEALVRSLLQG